MSAVIFKELCTSMNRQWRFRILWRLEPIVVRDLVDKVGRVPTKFQTAGSVASNADPTHADLPFAGICVLIPVLYSRFESGVRYLTITLAHHQWFSSIASLFDWYWQDYFVDWSLRRDRERVSHKMRNTRNEITGSEDRKSLLSDIGILSPSSLLIRT